MNLLTTRSTRRTSALTLPLIVIAAIAACTSPPEIADSGRGQTRDVIYFLKRLHQLEHLPALEDSRTTMVSTWDRTGANDDSADFPRIEGDRNILLDAKGPGCVNRIYTALLGDSVKGSRIQIFLDGAARPIFDMPVGDFFSARKRLIPTPLTTTASAAVTQFPIPFARRCLIQLVNTQPNKNWGVYWQITHTAFSAGTPVRTLTWPLGASEQQELQRAAGAWSLATQMPPAPPAAWTENRRLTIPPGQKGQVTFAGSGVIRDFRVKVTPRTAALLQAVRLRIFWDGAAPASVDVPLGFLFGHGDAGDLEGARYNSLLTGVTAEQAYFRFPMPFSGGARIELHNTSAAAASVQLWIDRRQMNSIPDSWGRLHATWHRRPAATAAAPVFGPKNVPGHVLLERKARGKYVGMINHLVWPYLYEWWGEGDWIIWSDESGWPPAYHGTGTEEYCNSGWTFFDRKPVSGYIRGRPGAVAIYSYHLNDAFQFQSNIKVVQETVGSLGGDLIIRQKNPPWGTTAFWYAHPAQAAGSTPTP